MALAAESTALYRFYYFTLLYVNMYVKHVIFTIFVETVKGLLNTGNDKACVCVVVA